MAATDGAGGGGARAGLAAAGGDLALDGTPRPRRTIDTGPDAHRIAVLYFDDLSKDHSLGPLADGLTDGLIRSLSGASSFTVISSAGVGRFRGSSLAPDSIARALRAGYLVRGEIEPEGDKIRVGVRLEDASGVNLQAHEPDVRRRRTSLAIRDTLSRVVADLIRRQLGEQFKLQQRARGRVELRCLAPAAARPAGAQGDGDRPSLPAIRPESRRAYRAADSLFAAAGARDPKWPDPETQRASLAYRRSRLAGGDPSLVRKWVTQGLDARRRGARDRPRQRGRARAARRRSSTSAGFRISRPIAAKKAALITAAKTDLEKSTTINHNQAGAWATLSHLYYNYPTSTTTPTCCSPRSARTRPTSS